MADRVPYPHRRVERGVGVLENNLHLSPQRSNRSALGFGDVPILKDHLTACRFDQSYNSPTNSRLPATALANQSHDLPGLQNERNTVHGMNNTLLSLDDPLQAGNLDRKMDLEILHPQNLGALRVAGMGQLGQRNVSAQCQ